MSIVIKKVSDANGLQFDVPFWQDGSSFYPMQKSGDVGSVPTPFYRFADVNGDGSGAYDMNGDYSAGAEIAYVQPGAGQILRLERVIVYMRDTGSFDTGGYGNGPELTNGIILRVQDNSGTLVNLTSQETIVTNGGWASYCHDCEVRAWGTGDEFLTLRWTFGKAGFPIRLVGDNNERLEFVLNDDFTNLVHHAFHLQGFFEVS